MPPQQSDPGSDNDDKFEFKSNFLKQLHSITRSIALVSIGLFGGLVIPWMIVGLVIELSTSESIFDTFILISRNSALIVLGSTLLFGLISFLSILIDKTL